MVDTQPTSAAVPVTDGSQVAQPATAPKRKRTAASGTKKQTTKKPKVATSTSTGQSNVPSDRVLSKANKQKRLKKAKEKWEKMNNVEKANYLFTRAAGIINRVKGLKRKKDEKGEKAFQSRLVNAIQPLYQRGQAFYDSACELVSKMSDMEKEEFWNKQIRNRNVARFDDLITIKEYNKRQDDEFMAKYKALEMENAQLKAQIAELKARFGVA